MLFRLTPEGSNTFAFLDTRDVHTCFPSATHTCEAVVSRDNNFGMLESSAKIRHHSSCVEV